MFGLSRRWLSRMVGISAAVTVALIGVSGLKAERGPKVHSQVIIPGEDRFTPFALTPIWIRITSRPRQAPTEGFRIPTETSALR